MVSAIQSLRTTSVRAPNAVIASAFVGQATEESDMAQDRDASRDDPLRTGITVERRQWLSLTLDRHATEVMHLVPSIYRQSLESIGVR